MKATIRLFAFLPILLIAFSCSTNKRIADSNSVILPLSDSMALRDGSIVYGLPRTVFTVAVEMERTIDKPGPYAQYAEDLLGLTNVIKNENESWTIENITVKSHDELDPSEYYVINSTSLFQTNVLTLRKEGLILDLNPSVFYSAEKQGNINESGNLQLNSYDLGSDEYFQLQRDTAYKRLNVDSSFVRIPYIVEKKKKLAVDQLAEKAAKRLLELRDGKHLILTGEATVFPQNDAAINEINRLEKAYTELFTGKTIKETFTFSYQIIPQKSMVGKPVALFQFSDLTGPIKSAANGGKAVTIEFSPEKKTKDLTIINRLQSRSEAKKFDRLFYRVPDVVGIKINLGSEKLFDSRKLIYQFGEIIQLPANYIIGK
jgi:predicted nucleic acid-binding protein